MLPKFVKTPVTLFRIQSNSKVKLREYFRQKSDNRPAFDFKLQSDGLVHPIKGDVFTFPNGMSLRPAGPSMYELLSNYRGNTLFLIPKDTPIPSQLILYLEHHDHYSLQTSVKCTEKELNNNLTTFISRMQVITKQAYFEQFPF